MTDVAQTTFAEGFVRPAVPDLKLSADITAKLPNAPQIKPIDVAKAKAAKPVIDAAWTKQVLGQ
jgi:putative spermidine/putrescine transport system substrate-binding protein